MPYIFEERHMSLVTESSEIKTQLLKLREKTVELRRYL